VLARSPVRRSAGVHMFAGFSVAGAATIVFGLSDNLSLFIASLMVDMLSSMVRQTLILVTTPDGRRGRVPAVNCKRSFFPTAVTA
jgi:hypothetical protein